MQGRVFMIPSSFQKGATTNVTEADGFRLKYLMPYNNKQDDDDDVDDDVDDNDDNASGDKDDKNRKLNTALTKAPCYESVRWIVLKDVMKMSKVPVSIKHL